MFIDTLLDTYESSNSEDAVMNVMCDKINPAIFNT